MSAYQSHVNLLHVPNSRLFFWLSFFLSSCDGQPFLSVAISLSLFSFLFFLYSTHILTHSLNPPPPLLLFYVHPLYTTVPYFPVVNILILLDWQPSDYSRPSPPSQPYPTSHRKQKKRLTMTATSPTQAPSTVNIIKHSSYFYFLKLDRS